MKGNRRPLHLEPSICFLNDRDEHTITHILSKHNLAKCVYIVSLEVFEDFLGLKSHLFEDFRPNKSLKRFYFRSLKLTYFEDLLVCLFCLLLTDLHYISIRIFIILKYI